MQARLAQHNLRKMMAVILLFALAGCASQHNQQVVQHERMLSAAGFKIRHADTPQKFSQLKQLPQHKVVARKRDDTTQYLYADADYCKCLFTGTTENYKRYRKLALDKQITEEDRIAEDRSQPAKMDWGDWRFFEAW
jgi:hypothetical protein